MSSRADSASPPPYSYENSSFVPPPPRVGQVSRSWDFQMRFEAAHESVRWAILDTMTAWKVSRRGLPWVYTPRSDVQDAYDAAPADLRIALDYIVRYNITTYFNDDCDRRRHDYFRRRDAGCPAVGGGRVLLNSAQFKRDFLASTNSVQKAILMTFAWWDFKNIKRYEEPSVERLPDSYRKMTEDRKVLLNWMLEIGADYGMDTLRSIPNREDSIRQAFADIHKTRHQSRSLFR
ncbi:hypothetical protein PENSPDRAFT_760438 [Peniophora sp. CONT]|nr:hypothetical protein PENSPDRAFT_760438 [Peniophora sp. CONT]